MKSILGCLAILFSLNMVSMLHADPACDMHTLIQKNEYKKAQLCLEQQKADPNQFNSADASLLSQLFRYGDVKVDLMHESIYDLAEALILNGADVNHRTPGQLTPFQTVLAEGDSSEDTKKMVALMLDHGADPETVVPGYYACQVNPESRITPLVWAIKSHQNGILEKLMNKGVHLERIPWSKGLSPLETCLKYQNDFAFKQLLVHGVQIPGEKTERYLLRASRQMGRFDPGFLQTIIAYDWQVKWSSAAAAQKVAFQLYQHPEMPSDVFKQAMKNWNIQLPDTFFFSAIQADKGNDNPLFQALLEMGLDADLRLGKKQNTLLQVLADPSFCNLKKVELLIQYGADVNAQDTDGDTAVDQIRFEMKKLEEFIASHSQKPDKLENRYSKEGDINSILAMTFGESTQFSPVKKAHADKIKLSKMETILLN